MMTRDGRKGRERQIMVMCQTRHATRGGGEGNLISKIETKRTRGGGVREHVAIHCTQHQKMMGGGGEGSYTEKKG